MLEPKMRLYCCTFLRLGRSASRVVLGFLALGLGISLYAHPDKVERQLLTHFATGVHRPAAGVWEDITHRATAKMSGAPIWTNLGPAQAVALNGVTDYFVVAESPDS